MAANINGCIIDMLSEGHHVYNTIWNAFAGEVLMHEQETQINSNFSYPRTSNFSLS